MALKRLIFCLLWITPLCIFATTDTQSACAFTSLVESESVTDTLGFPVQGDLLLQPMNTPTFGFMMMQMLGMLLLISAVLYLGLFFVKKVNAKLKNKNEALSFKVHENIYFSAKQGLSAVSFGDKLYIVGFSQNSVNLIDVIEDPDIIPKLAQTNPQQKKFTDLLSGYFSKEQKGK